MQFIRKQLSINEARNARDSLARDLYDKLFNSIVYKLNETTSCSSSPYHIGILDMPGFGTLTFVYLHLEAIYFDVCVCITECMESNSFEQLCINYANEKLQMFITHKYLQQEQDLFLREGLSFTKIEFEDNKNIIGKFSYNRGF